MLGRPIDDIVSILTANRERRRDHLPNIASTSQIKTDDERRHRGETDPKWFQFNTAQHNAPVKRSTYDDLFTVHAADNAWDRFKNVFVKNEYGFRSFELGIAGIAALASFCSGFLIHGMLSQYISHEKYRINNRGVNYLSKVEMQTRYFDYVMMQAVKQGAVAGVKYAMISGVCVLCVSTVSAIKNHASLSDLVLGFTVGPCLYYWYRGPRAMIGGGLLGAVFGATCVLPAWGICRASGYSYNEAYHKAKQEHFEFRLRQAEKHTQRLMSAKGAGANAMDPKEREIAAMEQDVKMFAEEVQYMEDKIRKQ